MEEAYAVSAKAGLISLQFCQLANVKPSVDPGQIITKQSQSLITHSYQCVITVINIYNIGFVSKVPKTYNLKMHKIKL